MLDDTHIMTKNELLKRLNDAVGHTLGELDTHGEFASLSKSSKKTGVAGNVIENSVLDYGSNSEQEPDIIVDGTPTEVKTTGVRKSDNASKLIPYEAKEPITITSVSLDEITNETYFDSHFWHKIAHLLFIYYLYDASGTVRAIEYANFPVLGYDFVKFTDSEKAILKNDWELVKSFIQEIKSTYQDPSDGYPLISSSLNRNLMFIDTAPKFKEEPRTLPRFRLRRDFVTSIVRRHFDPNIEALITDVRSYSDFDELLHAATQKYAGKTIQELIKLLHIDQAPIPKKDGAKNCAEQIVSAIFGSKAKKFRNAQLFNELGIESKTLTIKKSGSKTEDTKFTGLNVFNWGDEEDEFTDSQVYSYFANSQFLVSVFEEPSEEAKLLDNKLVGFKRFTFNQAFIDKYVKKLWIETRNLFKSGNFKVSNVYTKTRELRITPKTGLPMTKTNLMKSKDNPVFFKGSGHNAEAKNFEFNGYKTYRLQDVWVRGDIMIELLESAPYL